MNQEIRINPDKLEADGSIVLIGMAGAGKTTIGRLLARELDWAHLDTDQVIEAYYGAPLQNILDAFGLERFMDLEGNIVGMLNARRTVISTGGSVIYREHAMAQLKKLGRIVLLDIAFPLLEQRLTVEGRALCIGQGQSLQDLYDQRQPLYKQAADFLVDTGENTPRQSVDTILHWLGT